MRKPACIFTFIYWLKYPLSVLMLDVGILKFSLFYYEIVQDISNVFIRNNNVNLNTSKVVKISLFLSNNDWTYSICS
jgi:hypothetical protein